jgi:transcriptional regulator with XRE-family HTH domain
MYVVNMVEYDEDIYDTIRKNIRKYRREKKITSSELAERVDLSHDFIRQIQSDKSKHNFSVKTLYKISVALGVSMDDLVSNPDYEKIPYNQK